MVWTKNRPLGLTYRDADRSEGGYTLFSSVRGKHATLVDEAGRIVHRWRGPDEGIQYARLLPNGRLLARTHPPADAGGCEDIGGSSGSLIELDWSSEVLWRYDNPYFHHDFHRLDDGNTLICLWRPLPEGLSEQVRGGYSDPQDPARMWGDVVQEITPDGDAVYEWRSWEHLSLEDDFKCPLESRKEWTHLNSITLTPTGDMLLSFRLVDLVATVDRATGGFLWKWGRNTLSHQHHASWLDNGHVLVFDNGCHRRGGPAFSRVVEVDPKSDEVVWSYRAHTILAFSSFMVSGAERLAGGNTFITEGATGRLFEVTPEREIVWEYVSPFLFGSKFGPTPAIFRAHRYAADDPRLEGAPLDPDRYAALTESIQAGQFPEDD